MEFCVTFSLIFSQKQKSLTVTASVADPDLGSGIRCPFDPGSGIGFFWIADLGSQTHKFFLYLFKNKIMFNFVIFVATKKVGQQICFTLLFC
jgi:hypothetical protein